MALQAKQSFTKKAKALPQSHRELRGKITLKDGFNLFVSVFSEPLWFIFYWSAKTFFCGRVKEPNEYL